MTVSRFSKTRSVPSVTTKKSAPTTTNFAKGINTYKPNDTMEYDEIFLAQNARFERIGEYKTRRGLVKYTADPIGKTTLTSDWDTSKPYSMKVATQVATQLNVSQPIHSVRLMLALAEGYEYAILEVRLLNYDSRELLDHSFVEVTSTAPTETEVLFRDGLAQGNVHMTFRVASGSADSVLIARRDDGSAGCMRTAFGATQGKIIGLFEANIDGTKTVLFAFKSDADGSTQLYRTNESGGASRIRTLPSGVQKVRFLQNLNKIRYVDGVESPRIIDPANNWSDTAITTTDLKTGTNLNIKPSNIMNGSQDNIMYFNSAVDTEAVWTYPYNFEYNNAAINSYDKFDVDFYQNFPALQTGDPLTAMFNLGGIVYFLTRRNKYYMYSQTADVWTQQASSAQHGTFSQESVACDLNYAYYASDDGIFVFDGSAETSITEKTIQSTYDAIQGKESIVLELYGNRLYVFYSTAGDGTNDACLVYNTSLRLWESFDTGVPVSATIARQTASNRFICGSSKWGQLYFYETADGAYADLGAPIDFDLETSYLHFGTPSQLHRITKWRPEFSTTPTSYTVKCGYAVDFSDDVKYAYSINLKDGTILDEHYVWDNPPAYGNEVTPTKLTTIPKVYGQFRRCQLRYQHHAAFEPVSFKSHTLTVQTERIR